MSGEDHERNTDLDEQGSLSIIPHAWRDSMVASLFSFLVTTGLLYLGLSWIGTLHPSNSQLDPRLVAVVDFIDSLFGWGVFLVPVSFSFRTASSLARRFSFCLLASVIGLLISGLETCVLLVDPRFRLSALIYIAAGVFNALLATLLMLRLRSISAGENGN
ncbi:MAG TPA: hypothetical protein VHZ28_05845 [Terracidiphilus sp.]|jgi:hypothetical protein|nr:hypothetical protein [Terracidiphilus sp.]